MKAEEHSQKDKAKIALACAAHSDPVTKRLHHGDFRITMQQFPEESRTKVLRYWKQSREGHVDVLITNNKKGRCGRKSKLTKELSNEYRRIAEEYASKWIRISLRAFQAELENHWFPSFSLSCSKPPQALEIQQYRPAGASLSHWTVIKIQQDGARPHEMLNKSKTQSPDLNLLNLSYFHSLKSGVEALKVSAKNIDQLSEKVQQAYDQDSGLHLGAFVCLLILKDNGGNQYPKPHTGARNQHKVQDTSVDLTIDIDEYNRVHNDLRNQYINFGHTKWQLKGVGGSIIVEYQHR
eukprot:scaffold458_cov169-Ochromonas_danica.AAC.6